MPHSTSATSDSALAHLRTLLEVNAQIARERHDLRLEGTLNDEVRGALELVTRTAAVHRDELSHLIREWEATSRGERPPQAAHADTMITSRELIESWLAIKESSAEIYQAASDGAPTGSLRRRLRDLAHEDEAQAERLRAFL